VCEGGEQLSENETREKCEGLAGYWGPTGGWPWGYEKAKPKHIRLKMGLTVSLQQQKFFVLKK